LFSALEIVLEALEMSSFHSLPSDIFSGLSEYLSGLDIISLWTTGNKRIQRALSSGVTHFHVEWQGEQFFVWPSSIFSVLPRLRSLIVKNRSELVNLFVDGATVASIPASIESIELRFFNSFAAFLEDPPKIVYNQYIEPSAKDYVFKKDLATLFPRLHTLKVHGLLAAHFNFFSALPSTITSLEVISNLSAPFASAVSDHALPPNLVSFRSNMSLTISAYGKGLPQSLTSLDVPCSSPSDLLKNMPEMQSIKVSMDYRIRPSESSIMVRHFPSHPVLDLAIAPRSLKNISVSCCQLVLKSISCLPPGLELLNIALSHPSSKQGAVPSDDEELGTNPVRNRAASIMGDIQADLDQKYFERLLRKLGSRCPSLKYLRVVVSRSAGWNPTLLLCLPSSLQTLELSGNFTLDHGKHNRHGTMIPTIHLPCRSLTSLIITTDFFEEMVSLILVLLTTLKALELRSTSDECIVSMQRLVNLESFTVHFSVDLVRDSSLHCLPRSLKSFSIYAYGFLESPNALEFLPPNLESFTAYETCLGEASAEAKHLSNLPVSLKSLTLDAIYVKTAPGLSHLINLTELDIEFFRDPASRHAHAFRLPEKNSPALDCAPTFEAISSLTRLSRLNLATSETLNRQAITSLPRSLKFATILSMDSVISAEEDLRELPPSLYSFQMISSPNISDAEALSDYLPATTVSLVIGSQQPIRLNRWC
jgi:hypothetical protein